MTSGDVVKLTGRPPGSWRAEEKAALELKSKLVALKPLLVIDAKDH